MSVEQNPELPQIILSPEQSYRPLNVGAEKWLGVPIPVLDKGFVYLVDYMGNDESIEQAARVSYGSGTRSVNETTGLIRYLRRHHHTTPFEMAELKFHAKLPIVVAAQWIRHRTANVNQLSGRYSILDNEFYIPKPEIIGVQSSVNRQGRGETVEIEAAERFRQWLMAVGVSGYESYERFLDEDQIARELARMGLSQNLYTQWYWKCDLHNIFHFLGLRMDSHAQWEIRQYADAMARIVQESFPISYQAFLDYELNATSLSAPEIKILQTLVLANDVTVSMDVLTEILNNAGISNKRERAELIDKIASIGVTING